MADGDRDPRRLAPWSNPAPPGRRSDGPGRQTDARGLYRRGVDLRRLLPVAVLLGAADAVLFLGFEWLVNHGTDWLWNDLVGTDTVRWRVIPLAMVLSVAYSLLLRALREPRVTKVEPHTGIEVDDSKPATFRAVWVILVVGLAGLLAGASLGPEMPLFAGSVALGLWAGTRAKSPVVKLYALASVSALLVAFFASLVPVLIPAAILFRQQRANFVKGILPVLLASLTSFATLNLLSEDHGFGTVPESGAVEVSDYLIAFGLGIATVLIAAVLKQLILLLGRLTLELDRRWPWFAAALLFGAVIGILYLAGGETVQFSGSSGSTLLLSRAADYTTLAVAGIIAVKLLVTAWSLTVGYRGGLIFPSVFTGVAASLVVVDLWSAAAGPGVVIGAVAGITTAMTSPVLGPVIMLSLLPFSVLGVAIAGAAGAVAGDLAFVRLGLLPKEEPALP